MSQKKINSLGGLVYSTDPAFKPAEMSLKEQETLPPAAQNLKIKLDTKQRAGKAVTLVLDFTGKVSDLETLGKQLKSFCGTGGSVKERAIIVQGDNRDKILQWLHQRGYNSAKKI